MTHYPRYDLFAGALDKNPVWLGAFDDLNKACVQMRERARVNAGRYFVYNHAMKRVFAVVDTRLTMRSNRPLSCIQER